MRLGRRAAVVLALLLPVLTVASTGCAGKGSGAAQTQLTVTGSTTVLPIAEVAAEQFHTKHPNLRVLVAGVGSSAGIESVSNGTSDIGTSSRDLKPEEASLGLVDTPIAYDAIAVIVNPANPVTGLTKAQIAAIFEGKVSNWKDVGGPDMPIGLVNRDEASGTREAFTKIVLGGKSFDTRAAVLPGTGQVRSVVAGSPTAIGYISLGFVDNTVKALTVDGIVPAEATVANRQYPISRLLHFFTKGAPNPLSKLYIDFVLSDAVQESVVREAGFTPIKAGGK
jgi:phosphate transport system substrate-binding protein